MTDGTVDSPPQKRPFAWQPLTGRGVAAFAGASLGRLLLVQLVFALVGAGVVVWFLDTAWFPAIQEAIRQLPPEGEIRDGSLEWQGDWPARLAEGRFLALAVDLKHEGQARSPAHLEVEFGEKDVKVFSLLGFAEAEYPRGWRVAFNRPELEPWWGAWRPAILAMVAGLVVAGSLASWALLAAVYCWPAWLIGFFADRDAGPGGSWRVAGAAQMPGALVLTAGIVCYGLGALDLVRLAVAAGADLFLGWVYLFAGMLCLPRYPAAAGLAGNPFMVGGKATVKAGEEKEKGAG